VRACCLLTFLFSLKSILASSDIESPPHIQEEEGEQEDDIDWDKLAQTEPTHTDVPIFLGALSRKEAANEHFAATLDECHSSLHECIDTLLQTVAGVHNMHSNQMEAMEADIKHKLVCNHESRGARSDGMATPKECCNCSTRNLCQTLDVCDRASSGCLYQDKRNLDAEIHKVDNLHIQEPHSRINSRF
jgi:hypothetical protein